MLRLIDVEVRRFLARRAFRLLALAILAGIVLSGILVFVNARADVQQITVPREECIFDSTPGAPPGVPPEEGEEECHEVDGGVMSYEYDRRFHLVNLRGAFVGIAGMVGLLGLVVGGSFIGAEWQARTLATTLTWEPRRARLLVGKVVALGVMIFLSSVVIHLLLTASILPAALLRGTTQGADAAWLRDLVGVTLRTTLLAVGGAAMGFSIATIARNSAAAIGIAFLYLAAFEGVLRALRPMWQPYLLGSNVAAMATWETQRFLVSAGPFGPEDVVEVTPVEGSIGVVVYVLALFALAVASFRRRELA